MLALAQMTNKPFNIYKALSYIELDKGQGS